MATSEEKNEPKIEYDDSGFVLGYQCPFCCSQVKFDHTDDVGTKFFKCEKCGRQLPKLQSIERKEFEENSGEESREEDSDFEIDYDVLKFESGLFGDKLIKKYHFKTMKDNDELLVYNKHEGIWEARGETFIKQKLAKGLKLNLRQQYYPDVESYVKWNTYEERPTPPRNKISIENGILNVESGTLEPFNPEEFIIAKVPHKYDPHAKCERIRKFLMEVVGEEQLSLIQETIGYCLLQDMPFHKAVMLIGEGANGKSTLLNLIKTLLGSQNISDVTLQALCIDRFATAELYGKLANLCADLPDTALQSTGTFKMITGNDPITAERKYQQKFTFKNYAKLIFSTNKAPETKDDTTAFWRRWIILSCSNRFLGSKCDPKILEKITTEEEMSGLLNYALEGLSRILKNGGFSQNEDIEQMRAQYIRKSNSAKAFIEEKLEPENDPKAFIIETELYSIYVLFCEKEKLPSMPKRNFTMNMQQFASFAKQTTERVEGKKGVHVWQYLKMKESVAPVASGLLLPSRLPDTTGIGEATEATNFHVKHVLPGEPCEACRCSAVEWEIQDWRLDDSEVVLHICNSCFNEMRHDGVKFKFLEEDG